MSKPNGSTPGPQQDMFADATEEQDELAPAAHDEAAEAEAQAADVAEGDAPEAEPAPPEEVVVELVNNHQGCWKVLDDGERVELSEEEWRQALSRQFRKARSAELA